jgi:hypothetical protein
MSCSSLRNVPYDDMTDTAKQQITVRNILHGDEPVLRERHRIVLRHFRTVDIHLQEPKSP